MKTKLILLLFVLVALVFTFAACDGATETTTESTTTAPAVTTTIPVTTTSVAVTSATEENKHPAVTQPATTVGKDSTVDTKPLKPTTTPFSSYQSILELCRTIVYSLDTVNQNPQGLADNLFGFDDSTEKEWFLEIYYALHYLYRDRTSPENKLSLGYAVKDLNRDGVDELVLLDDRYTVGAIFSMANGKPVLLGDYYQRDSAWIDENGWIHRNGSGGADCWLNAVYKIGAGGASFELITEFGADGFEWVGEEAVTIYYKLVNGEKIRITEAEYDSLAEQYGEYLGWVKAKEATKEKAGLTFVSLFVTSELETFLSQDVKNSWKDDLVVLLSQMPVWEPENSIPGSYAVGLFDLNFDNTPEVLVAYPGGSMGNIFVKIYDLKHPDEPLCYYDATHSGEFGKDICLYIAKSDGKYVIIAEGAIRGRSNRIELLSSEIYGENHDLESEELFGVGDTTNNPEQYYVKGEPVEKSKYDEEYQKFLNEYIAIDSTEIQLVEWSDFDLSNKEQLALGMADALLSSSQQFIDYKN